jgi:mannosyl-3-phosphoglycerate phosphatase
MAITTIIFTDLDGTLLHPKTYSFEEARAALDEIKKRNIPIVLCSSKTQAEIEAYRKRLDNRHPFMSENGGGIFIPEGYFPFPVGGEPRGGYRVMSLGTPYAEIRKQFTVLRERVGIKAPGFGDMSALEVATRTGLPEAEAALAKMRDFDEPFLIEENSAKTEALLRAIEERGYHWTQGRFYHVLGNHDKGRAVNILKRLYERQYGAIRTIGIGDSRNDVPLLRTVDLPVLVRKKDGTYEPGVDLPDLIKADGIGPEGWSRAIMRLLAE